LQIHMNRRAPVVRKHAARPHCRVPCTTRGDGGRAAARRPPLDVDPDRDL